MMIMIAGVWLSIDQAFASRDCRSEIADVVSIQGIVELRRAKETVWQPVQIDQIICTGDIIRTRSHSRAALRLRNESVLRLDQKTGISFDDWSGEKNASLMELLEGAMHVITRTPKPFRIRTPFLNGSVEGTEFFVEVTGGAATIAVYEGRVVVGNESGSIILNDREAATAHQGQAPSHGAIVRLTDAVQWALYYPAILSAMRSESRQDPLIQQAGHLLIVGQAAEARIKIEQALANDTSRGDAHALLAVIAVVQNDKDRALTWAAQAVMQNPASTAAHFALSYAKQANFEIEGALQSIQQVIALDPHNSSAWARAAELHMSLGNLDRALEAARYAAGLNPEEAKAQTVLGFAHLLQIDIRNAKAIFRRAILQDQTDPMPRFGLGLTLIREGDLEKGRAEIEIAASLNPGNSLIRSYLGKAYYEEKRNALAEDQFDFAKLLDEKDPTPFFYNALHKQTVNQPAEALREMRQAIELNHQRAVYRSKMLLDRDLASRQAGLGRIFHGLGFDDVAHIQATRSLALDPGNYSAHRLLSDSYADRPRHEVARASQYLQSLLMQPINHNPIQPSLAYSDLNVIRGLGPYDAAFNEYNRLFERNGIRLAATGNYGSYNTHGNETALSGVYNKFSFSAGQHYSNFHGEFGGGNNRDIRFNHQLYNVFTQYQLSPKVNIQAEYRRRETEHNDLVFRGNILATNSDYRRGIVQDSYRFGINIAPTQNSNLLFSYIHSVRDEKIRFMQDFSLLNKTYSHNYETQYLVRNDQLNLMVGGGAYLNDNHWNIYTKSDTTHLFSYLYSNLKLADKGVLTAGFSYDKYTDNFAPSPGVDTFNPKLGVEWFLSKNLSLRAASFRTVKSPIYNNQLLQPVQIARFIQYFDDINGTVSWQNGVGLDAALMKNMYAGAEVYKRDLEIPIYRFSIKPDEMLYRGYFHWSPHSHWVFNSELRIEDFKSDGMMPAYPKRVETLHFPSEIRYFHPNGFFASFKGTFVDQRCKLNCNAEFFTADNPGFKSDFVVFDTSIGFRLPRQYGVISFDAKNLFDQDFEYRDRNYLLNATNSYLPEYLPGRLLFARIALNY
ncbi:MAG: FecR domain-containing protein [Nitrosomonas sp.]|nr:MAG: FecR domain-containing protein [Nitrosomonas sp.]